MAKIDPPVDERLLRLVLQAKPRRGPPGSRLALWESVAEQLHLACPGAAERSGTGAQNRALFLRRVYATPGHALRRELTPTLLALAQLYDEELGPPRRVVRAQDEACDLAERAKEEEEEEETQGAEEEPEAEEEEEEAERVARRRKRARRTRGTAATARHVASSETPSACSPAVSSSASMLEHVHEYLLGENARQYESQRAAFALSRELVKEEQAATQREVERLRRALWGPERAMPTPVGRLASSQSPRSFKRSPSSR